MPLITGKTQLLAVIGDPVSHSLSPLMHNAAIAHLGLDYVYVALPIKMADLAAALAGFAAIGLQGFNITLPHKQAIMPLLTTISETAAAVGAVNTVWPTPQGWQGTNTDVEGFLAPLRLRDRPWSQQTALILGNGGAARAVVAGLVQMGLGTIQVVGRSSAKLATFAQSWDRSPLRGNLQIQPWSALSQLLPQAGLVVNTTPVGMAPQVEQSPLDETEIALLPAGAIVYDLIYVPKPTRLLAMAQKRGLGAIDGLEMLVQQGAAALQIWTGQTPPIAIMRNTLETHLNLASSK